MVYNDDRDYDKNGILSEEAENDLEENKATVDWNEIRKVKPLDLRGTSTAVIEAWSSKEYLRKINIFLAKVYRAGGYVVNIKRTTGFWLKYKVVVFYYPNSLGQGRVSHPMQNKVAEPTRSGIDSDIK